ncbi:uncharacterized protein LOC129732545 [Wyeomyia smithii]|uniref:uncharacterized protein LOC129732545 n=1 Tax=Wyeomyia smithii TaxID=174621 RepID=UPI0024680854|nr:uncharacterized protein LOC129732545 [Wyeomyia smithii]
MEKQTTLATVNSPTDTVLNLSTDSGFYTDWKYEYQLDTEQGIANPYPTDTIMPAATRMISTLCAFFKLPHSIEFSAIDTLEQLVIETLKKDASPDKFAENVVENLPFYVIAILSLVSKCFNARTILDPALQKQILQANFPDLEWNEQKLATIEFKVMKTLNYKVSQSLLLGAVERFTKEDILTRGIARKDFVGSLGIKLLRVVYAQKSQIYASLKPNVKCQDLFTRFKSNKLILAAATVTAILKFCAADEELVADNVVKRLSNDCFVEPKNITLLRDAIVNVIR